MPGFLAPQYLGFQHQKVFVGFSLLSTGQFSVRMG